MTNIRAIAAVACGMPFSGTTYLSRLMCAHPLIDSGFECGLLFGNRPQDFPDTGRYYRWMTDPNPPYNWLFDEEELTDICQSQDFYQAYAKMVQYCHLFKGDKQYVIDKTPAYVYELIEVMHKLPETPVVVVQKNALDQYYSFKKREMGIGFFKKKYADAKEQLYRIKQTESLQGRLLILQFDDLERDMLQGYQQIIEHIARFHQGIQFDEKQLPQVVESMDSDIKGRKKLRRRFSHQAEKEALEEVVNENEIKQIEELVLELEHLDIQL